MTYENRQTKSDWENVGYTMRKEGKEREKKKATKLQRFLHDTGLAMEKFVTRFGIDVNSSGHPWEHHLSAWLCDM